MTWDEELKWYNREYADSERGPDEGDDGDETQEIPLVKCVCVHCGRHFVAVAEGQPFCSANCSDQHYADLAPDGKFDPAECIGCDDEIPF